MFDERCDDIRNVVHDALVDAAMGEDSVFSEKVKSVSMWFTDNGLAIQVDDAIYHVAIERV